MSGQVGEAPWRRLSPRVVWVDLVQSLLSLLPGLVAVAFFGVEPSWSSLWPLLTVAGFGIVGAGTDIVRWAFTRYRVTATEIERHTGIVVRRRRTVQRDRIRSVDSHARLRHRLAGLRVVTIGAGQQTGAGEAALVLDALSKPDAEALRQDLLRTAQPVSAAAATASDPAALPDNEEVFATFRPWWVVYNMFSIWAYLLAAGVLWGVFGLSSTFGIDLFGMVAGAVDWESLGWPAIVVAGLAAGGLFGALGMGISFLTSYWGFELTRVHRPDVSYLRTRRGLFSTREVNRDERRLRGLSIDEPLLWRWMGMADTNVITTGLGVWDTEQPTAVLPRGPIRAAREVATRILGDPSPLQATLHRHPPGALHRRLWWAVLAGLTPAAVVALPVVTGAVPGWLLGATLAGLPLALLAALISFRALGHTISGDYLVVRSGLMSRSTSALRRDAVSTIAVRQSVVQRHLGLSTVSAMTAAGWGCYEAPDLPADQAVEFATLAAPGVLEDLLITEAAR